MRGLLFFFPGRLITGHILKNPTGWVRLWLCCVSLSMASLFGCTRTIMCRSRSCLPCSARVRAAGDGVLEVTVEDRGATIVWPKLDIDFSVAEMLPEYLGIVTLRASARRAGKATSQAKTLAARVNGANGGGPRKIAREL